MTCALCGEEKKLIEAHIIPLSFHRIAVDSKPSRLLTNVDGRYAQKLPKGIYDDSILCEGCEQRFSSWDDYGHDLLIKSWDTFEMIEQSGTAIAYGMPNYDYQRLKLFFLSVLWRSAVSRLVMFSKVKLGSREAALKDSILRAYPGDMDHFGVVLQAFDSTEVGILDPHLERFSGLRFCRIYLSHIIAFIKVDSRPFEYPFKAAALSAERPLAIPIKNFMSSPERKVMKNLVLADIEKSRLTRR